MVERVHAYRDLKCTQTFGTLFYFEKLSESCSCMQMLKWSAGDIN